MYQVGVIECSIFNDLRFISVRDNIIKSRIMWEIIDINISEDDFLVN